MMNDMLAYLKSRFVDLVVLFAASVSLAMVVEDGFRAGSAVAGNPVLLLVLAAVELVILYTVSYSRKTAVAGIFIVLAFVILATVIASLFWDGSALSDEEGDVGLAVLIECITVVFAYLMTRKRALVIVFMLCGIMICGYIQFIYEELLILPVLVFFLSCLALLPLRNFSYAQRASEQPSERTWPAAVFCAAAGAVVLALSAGVFFAFIAPLNLQPMTIKVFREYVALPTVDMRGVADTTDLEDEDNQTDQTNDQTETSPEQDEQDDGTEDDTQENQNFLAPLFGGMDAFNSNADDPGYTGITYEQFQILLIILLILLVALIIALPIVIKKLLRKRRRGKIGALDNRAQVVELYNFFLKRFGRMKVGIRKSATADEYAVNNYTELSGFMTTSGVDIVTLTRIFNRARYGTDEITDEDVKAYDDFYNSFYKHCREYVGPVKYVFKFFRL